METMSPRSRHRARGSWPSPPGPRSTKECPIPSRTAGTSYVLKDEMSLPDLMLSRRLWTKRRNGFVKQRERSIWKRFFAKELLIQLQRLSNTGDATYSICNRSSWLGRRTRPGVLHERRVLGKVVIEMAT